MTKYRIAEIKLKINEEMNSIPDKIREKLMRRDLEITAWRVAKESIDARDKTRISRVFLVEFETSAKLNLEIATDSKYQIPKAENPIRPMSHPVIIGFGPCGIFAAWILASLGHQPIVLERGKEISKRDADVESFWQDGLLDPESNVQFGEGGAGAYSDGKLTTGTKDLRNQFVLEKFVQAGADPEILYKKKPHVGTDVLKTVVSNLRKQIEEMGGTVRFQAKATNLLIKDDKVMGVEVNGNEILYTEDVVLAIGHSARDTFRMLQNKSVPMEPKPFSMGVRIEHPQRMIDASQYGDPDLAKLLGPAEYKLVHHCKNGRGLYSFCMCPGGQVISASTEMGGVVVNGMSYHARDGLFANSGILTDVRVEDYYKGDPLDGMEFQRSVEQDAYAVNRNENCPPVTTWGEFRQDPNNPLRKCLPSFVVESILEGIPAFGHKIKGFDDAETRLTGVETRSSSPVRLIRNHELMSGFAGLYPGGEGAGYAGGIVSAAADGIRMAEAIVFRKRTD
jgi:uncharacterized protein